MKLLEFPRSHFCEKARWALDYKGIPFEAVAILPGFHRITVRKYARDSAVPVLLTDDGAVQGSSSLCRRNIHFPGQMFPTRKSKCFLISIGIILSVHGSEKCIATIVKPRYCRSKGLHCLIVTRPCKRSPREYSVK